MKTRSPIRRFLAVALALACASPPALAATREAAWPTGPMGARTLAGTTQTAAGEELPASPAPAGAGTPAADSDVPASAPASRELTAGQRRELVRRRLAHCRDHPGTCEQQTGEPAAAGSDDSDRSHGMAR